MSGNMLNYAQVLFDGTMKDFVCRPDLELGVIRLARRRGATR